MEKKLLLSALTGTFWAVLLLSGCGTIKIIAINETIPEEDAAVIFFYSRARADPEGITLKLKSLDGASLPKGFRSGSPLRLPAGEHTFTADVKWYSGLTVDRAKDAGGPYRTYFSAKKALFSYDFKPGISYYLEPFLGGGEGADVRMPPVYLSFSKPRRDGGEPFIGQIKVYAARVYDKKGFPLVTDDNLVETIGFTQEISF